jgi:cardiolipin synthase
MSVLSILVFSVFLINVFCVFTMIFIERKKPNFIVSWLLVLTFFPIIGFIFYVLIGSGLSYKTRRMLKSKRMHQKEYEEFVKSQKNLFLKKDIDKEEKDYADLILFNLNNSNSAYYRSNSVKVFLDGNEKIEALKKDLELAAHSINILYYIFANDEIGREIMEILIKKAKEGVKVKIIYDSVGSLKTKRSFFKRLKEAGGEISEFFPPLFGLRLMNLKANYRNHRKIVVIDGKIGYTGGINIRDDHLGRNKKLSPWRDTHMRICGDAVYGLQMAFFSDWRYCKKINSRISTLVDEGYFPKEECSGDVGVQIITSGPDLPSQPIKEALVKMIQSAKKYIYIETPYFIPDEVVLGALRIAQMSGVDIKVIIPSKPDKKFVYFATLSYVKDLLASGINFYSHNGFIHSKLIVVDDRVVSIGTCNFDNRSFALNFEINTFLYGKKFARKNKKYFLADLNNSKQITPLFFKRKPWINKIGQAFFRLFAPLL